MRTTAPGTTDRVYGWRLRGEACNPSPQARSSTPTAPMSPPEAWCFPESGVDYCVPPDLGGGEEATGHTH